jgi:hypothetical protein
VKVCTVYITWERAKISCVQASISILQGALPVQRMVQVLNLSSPYTGSIPESANKRPCCSRESGPGMADLSDAVVVVRG